MKKNQPATFGVDADVDAMCDGRRDAHCRALPSTTASCLAPPLSSPAAKKNPTRIKLGPRIDNTR